MEGKQPKLKPSISESEAKKSLEKIRELLIKQQLNETYQTELETLELYLKTLINEKNLDQETQQNIGTDGLRCLNELKEKLAQLTESTQRVAATICRTHFNTINHYFQQYLPESIDPFIQSEPSPKHQLLFQQSSFNIDHPQIIKSNLVKGPSGGALNVLKQGKLLELEDTQASKLKEEKTKNLGLEDSLQLDEVNLDSDDDSEASVLYELRQKSPEETQPIITEIEIKKLLEQSEQLIGKIREADKKFKSNPNEKKQFFNVPLPKENYVGRVEALQQIEFKGGKINHNVITSQIVSGMGGVGKTELAIVYAHTVREKYGNCVRLIEAESEVSLNNSFKRFAESLEIDISSLTEDAIVEAVYEKIKDTNWLLIFDNASSCAEIKSFLPEEEEKSNIHVLITSRVRRWYEKQFHQINIDVLSLLEAAALINFNAFKKEEKIEVEHSIRLAKLLGRLPLAIQQAVAYITMSSSTDIKGYIELYKEYKKKSDTTGNPLLEKPQVNPYTRVEQKKRRRKTEEDHQKYETVHTTWNITFDKLKSKKDIKYKNALIILKMSAYLYPDEIHETLFYKRFENKKMVCDAIDVLVDFNLIHKNSNKNESISFHIHRIMQDVLEIQDNAELSEQNKNKSEDLLASVELIEIYFNYERNQRETVENSQEYFLHAKSIIKACQRFNIKSKAFVLLISRCAQYLLYEKRLYRQASELLTIALGLNENNNFLSVFELGGVYSALGFCVYFTSIIHNNQRIERALEKGKVEVIRRIVKKAEENYKKISPGSELFKDAQMGLALLKNLSGLAFLGEDKEKALKKFIRSKKMEEDLKLEKKSPLYLANYINIAYGQLNIPENFSVINNISNLSEVKEKLKKIVDMHLSICGNINEDLIYYRVDYANVLLKSSEIGEAEKICEQAIEDEKKLHGENYFEKSESDSPTNIILLLANIYIAKNNIEAAHKVLDDFINKANKKINIIQGKKEFIIALAKYLKAECYLKGKNYEIEIVKKYAIDALEIFKVAKAEAEINSVLILLGKLKVDSKKILKFIEKRVKEIELNCSKVERYVKQKRYSECILLLNELVKVDSDNPKWYMMLGELNSKLEKNEEAIKSFELSIEKNKENPICYFKMFEHYVKIKEYDKAMVYINLAIQYDPNNLDYLYWKGQHLYGKNEYDSAKEQFEKIIDAESSDNIWKVHSYYYIGLCCIQTSYLEKAIFYFNRIESFDKMHRIFYYMGLVKVKFSQKRLLSELETHFEEAEEFIKKNQDIEHQDEFYRVKGNVYYEHFRFQNAIDNYRLAFKIAVEDETKKDILIQIALSYVGLKDYNSASKVLYEEFTKAYKPNTNFYSVEAWVLVCCQKYNQAKQALEKIKPNCSPEYTDMLVWKQNLAITIYYQSGDNITYEEIIDKILKVNDHFLFALFSKVFILVDKKAYEEASNYLQKYPELKKEKKFFNRVLIEINLGLGQYDQALKLLNELIETEDCHDVMKKLLSSRGDIYRFQKRFDLALKDYDDSTEMLVIPFSDRYSPTDFLRPYYGKTLIYLLQNKLEKATYCYEQMLKITEQHVWIEEIRLKLIECQKIQEGKQVQDDKKLIQTQEKNPEKPNIAIDVAGAKNSSNIQFMDSRMSGISESTFEKGSTVNVYTLLDPNQSPELPRQLSKETKSLFQEIEELFKQFEIKQLQSEYEFHREKIIQRINHWRKEQREPNQKNLEILKEIKKRLVLEFKEKTEKMSPIENNSAIMSNLKFIQQEQLSMEIQTENRPVVKRRVQTLDLEVLNRVKLVMENNLFPSETSLIGSLCFQVVPQNKVKLTTKEQESFSFVCGSIVKHEENIIKILDEASTEELLDIPDDWCNRPLHYACLSNNQVAIKYFLEKKLSLDEGGMFGLTPYHICALQGNIDLFKTLTEKGFSFGEDRLISCDFYVLNQKFSVKLDSLGLAVIAGQKHCLKYFFEKFDAGKSKNYSILLHLAILSSQSDMLNFLISKLVNQNTKQLLHHEAGLFGYYTPLALAIAYDDQLAMITLCEAGKQQGVNLLNVPIEGKQRRTIFQVVVDCALAQWSQQFKLFEHFIDENTLELKDENDKNIKKYVKSLKENLQTQEEQNNLLIRRYDRMIGFFKTWKKEIKKGQNKIDINQFKTKRIENIAFQGGGPKGIVYLGVLKYLKEKNRLSEVHRVAGTSAGAITAALFALGMLPEKMREKLNEMDMLKFLEKFDLQNMQDLLKKEKTNWETLKFTIKLVMNIFQIAQDKNRPISVKDFLAPFSKIKEIFQSLTGLSTGKAFFNWIEKTIREHTGVEYLTFGQYRKDFIENREKNKDNIYKHLYIVTVNEKTGDILVLNSEDEKWDNIIISSAVRASMSIPFLFEPYVLLYKNQQNGKIEEDERYLCTDGGVLKNYPIDAFDKLKFIAPNDLYGDKEFYRINPHTLGFKIKARWSEFEELIETENPQVQDVIYAIISIYLDAESMVAKYTGIQHGRTISIDPCGTKLTDFNMEKTKFELMVNEGYLACEKIFEPEIYQKNKFKRFKIENLLTQNKSSYFSIKEKKDNQAKESEKNFIKKHPNINFIIEEKGKVFVYNKQDSIMNQVVLKSQREINQIEVSEGTKSCSVVPVPANGNCGLAAIRYSLYISGYHELAREFTRENFIKKLESILPKEGKNPYIEEIFKNDKATNIQGWKINFNKKTAWIDISHIKFISKYYNIEFKLFCLEDGKFIPEPSNESIYEGDSFGSSKTICLAHIAAGQDTGLNHFDAIIVEPNQEQEGIINYMKKPSNAKIEEEPENDEDTPEQFSSMYPKNNQSKNQDSKGDEKQFDPN